MVRVGNGADGLIRELCVSYLEDGDEVITSASSFPVYDISTAVMRGRMVKTPLLRDLGFDLRAMAAAITGRTKLIFVSNPNNPTGTMVTAAEVAELMAVVPDRVLVIFDEAYFEFVDSADYPDTLALIRAGRKNVILLRTFSKAYGIAGIRIGYGIAQPELLAPLRAATESFPVNNLAQVAGLAALEDAEFVRRTVEVNRNGRRYLYREFDRLGLRYVPSHANFILVEFGPHAQAIYRKLLERGVIVRLCNSYDLPNHLRISVGLPEQNARLIAALEAVLRADR
jgi:histidinol-phosphate aminotransferase